VQTFYQPLFSHSFSFSNFPLAVLFPSVFSLPKASHTKKPKAKDQSKKPKLNPKVKAQGKKAKAPSPPSGVFYKQQQAGLSRGSWEGA
jgi:hypothetical protein